MLPGIEARQDDSRILGFMVPDEQRGAAGAGIAKHGLFDPAALRETVELDAPPQEIRRMRIRFNGHQPAGFAHQFRQQNRVISEIGAHIDRRHPGLDIARAKLRQPDFPETVEQQMRAEAAIPRVDVELVAAENTRNSGIISQIGAVCQLLYRDLQIEAFQICNLVQVKQ